MRRLSGIIILLVLCALPAGALLAQDDTAPDDIAALVEEARQAAERAEAAAQAAAAHAEDAGEAIGYAADLFGLFEAMSGAVGLVVPFLAVVGGLLGFRRLESAQNELREARERFERDMSRREVELDALRDELKASVQKQREDAGRASLALSLLPVGERQYRAQDYTGALDTYLRALELDPDNAIIHYRLGYVYSQSGDLDRAQQHLTRSQALDPGFPSAMAALGYVYRRMGDSMEPGVERDIIYNQAEQNFLKALELSPKLMDEDGESWWGALGGLYRRRGQVDQAIGAYERGTKVTPHSSYPFSNLALLYLQTHNRQRMIETYKRVERLAWGEVQAEVDNYWAYADLITARLALGKVAEAEEVLDLGLDAAPADSPYTLESLVDTLTRLSEVLETNEVPPVTKVIRHIRAFQEKRRASQQEETA